MLDVALGCFIGCAAWSFAGKALASIKNSTRDSERDNYHDSLRVRYLGSSPSGQFMPDYFIPPHHNYVDNNGPFRNVH